MEQYRFDPYTGQPLNPQRSVNNRTWLGGGHQPGGQVQALTQPPARQDAPNVIFRPVASFDEAKAFLEDKDARNQGGEKLARYYEYVVL